MPDIPKPAAASVNFDSPIKRSDLTGVEADESCTLRFGYKVKPSGRGCLHKNVEDIPADVMAWLLDEAKKQEEK